MVRGKVVWNERRDTGRDQVMWSLVEHGNKRGSLFPKCSGKQLEFFLNRATTVLFDLLFFTLLLNNFKHKKGTRLAQRILSSRFALQRMDFSDQGYFSHNSRLPGILYNTPRGQGTWCPCSCAETEVQVWKQQYYSENYYKGAG